MPSLHDVQASFRHYILGADSAETAHQFVSPFLPIDNILAIHRNNFRLTLTEALASNFPAVRNLVGEECFAAIAGRFVERHPPASPVLSAYGDAFPEFLDLQPSLFGVPYLGDVGRLEWAWNEAFHAADSPALTPDDLRQAVLAGRGDFTLTPHPSVRLVASTYAIERIWRMARRPSESSEEIDPAAGADRLLVARPLDEVTVTPLDPGTYSLIGALAAGSRLGEAVGMALRVSPEFSLEGSLGNLLARGIFASFTTQPGGSDK